MSFMCRINCGSMISSFRLHQSRITAGLLCVRQLLIGPVPYYALYKKTAPNYRKRLSCQLNSYMNIQQLLCCFAYQAWQDAERIWFVHAFCPLMPVLAVDAHIDGRNVHCLDGIERDRVKLFPFGHVLKQGVELAAWFVR